MQFQVGDEIGSYKIVGIAGWGATGVVFQVQHLLTRRVEAMKVLAEQMTADQDQACRFLREIRVQARMNHPHLVPVHNAFFEGQTLCLVMQWVEGEPLDRIIKAGGLAPPLAVDIACQVLSALAHAHEHGVIHRDVKPANILIDRSGQAKLTDFGLARPCTDLGLTQPGIALGSVHYMPPEQVRGLPTADARADLYSVGAVLYETVTGRKPFGGPDAFTVMKAQVEQAPVPPAQLVAGLPCRLNEAILRALSKDPERRFQTAGEFLGELEAVRIQAHLDSRKAENMQRPAEPRGRMRPAWLVLAVTAMLASLWFGYSGYRWAAAIMEALPPPPAIVLLPPPKPPPGALTLSPPLPVEDKPATASQAPPAKPRKGRIVSRAQPAPPRQVESASLPLQPPAPEEPTPPIAASAPEDPPEAPVTETVTGPSEAPTMETVTDPSEAVKKPGAVRRFFGRLNPVRIFRKGPQKPAAQEPPEEPN